MAVEPSNSDPRAELVLAAEHAEMLTRLCAGAGEGLAEAESNFARFTEQKFGVAALSPAALFLADKLAPSENSPPSADSLLRVLRLMERLLDGAGGRAFAAVNSTPC